MSFDRDAIPEDIRGYHRRTKHAPNRYAMGPGFLDWASQPNPFRRFAGARLAPLPLLDHEETAAFPGPAAAAAPVDAAALGLFLELAFGLSAWKSYENSTWALRNNPSSGNLHPTECYALLDSLAGVSEAAGLYHYAPAEHALEERAAYEAAHVLPRGGFLLALSSIAWREAWKYGERAYRYCQLDAGHAIGAAAQAAFALGWRASALTEPSDAEIAALIGLDREDAAHRREPEHPDLVMWISTEAAPAAPALDLFALIDAPRAFHGQANRLSEDHDGWPVIDLAGQFCRKPRQATKPTPTRGQWPAPIAPRVSIGRAVRKRRSAQRMDGATSMPAEIFAAMLAATLPSESNLLSAFPWATSLTLILFVHRVDGVEPGIYALQRDSDVAARLRAACRKEFEWSLIDLSGLPLYRLYAGAAEKAATKLACLQPISGKGCFSLAMIADFDHALEEDGPFAYRRLHFEAGLIGQALYLWATACGFAGTGIGCFFDDEAHELLGLSQDATQFQDVYHFTVGGAIDDARILTLPPYPDERRDRR
ncbi:SagB/ThcOx family dehydrogenase [Methylosinus sp. Sm6]|uniref:SagB/ThcOx family dehydrogenase n=1 Tax=Methylosinus sp. Sm6 TaxID=2866948 RepID=UPI001C99CDCF|nr:SagB/ThcOx family dehydrogenase [Methylosinus sp. Sm6]